MDKAVKKYRVRRDARIKKRMDAWEEGDHPRDENGRFTSGGGSSAPKSEKSSGTDDFFKESWSSSSGKVSKAKDTQKRINKVLEDYGRAEQKEDWRAMEKAGDDFASVLDDIPDGVSVTIRDHAVKPEYRDEGKISLKKENGKWMGDGYKNGMKGKDVWKMMDYEEMFDVEIDKHNEKGSK